MAKILHPIVLATVVMLTVVPGARAVDGEEHPKPPENISPHQEEFQDQEGRLNDSREDDQESEPSVETWEPSDDQPERKQERAYWKESLHDRREDIKDLKEDFDDRKVSTGGIRGTRATPRDGRWGPGNFKKGASYNR